MLRRLARRDMCRLRLHASKPDLRRSATAQKLIFGFRNSSSAAVRNVVVVAHVDAGKTTATERMLYYSGVIHSLGSVDEGTAATDFLPAERRRGISVRAAAATFGWADCAVSLIDSPGHGDFAAEPAAALAAADAALLLIDAADPIQPRTTALWDTIASRALPTIVFANKLDRPGASFPTCISAMRSRLPSCMPLPIQMPVFADSGRLVPAASIGGQLVAIADLVDLRRLDWASYPSGSVVASHPLIADPSSPLFHPEWADVASAASAARADLVETLANHDDVLLDAYLAADADHSQISPSALHAAIRRSTIARSVVPVLCGAALRNIGIQPIMDAIAHYLPSPDDAPPPSATLPEGSTITIPLSENRTCALAFKVVHDQARGPIVYVRVYSGTIESRSTLKIASASQSKPIKERATKLIQLYADEHEEVQSIAAGSIGAVVGFKHVRTGDTLVASNDPRTFRLHPIVIPPPVFVRSCEPASSSPSNEKALAEALSNLIREDPSLSISVNEETGQTLLGGLGELHLEIAGERLRDIYKVDCILGKVEISYRETLVLGSGNTDNGNYRQSTSYDTNLFGKRLKCDIELEMQPLYDPDYVYQVDGGVDSDQISQTPKIQSTTSMPSSLKLSSDVSAADTIVIDTKLTREMITIHKTDQTAPSAIKPKSASAARSGSANADQTLSGLWVTPAELSEAIEMGVRSAFSRGPILSFLVSHVAVRVRHLGLYGSDLSPAAAVRAAAHQCARNILDGRQSGSKNNTCRILEPVMNLEIRVPMSHVGPVSQDISGPRRGQVLRLDTAVSSDAATNVHPDLLTKHVIHARAPLSELVGYASKLQAITSGTADLSMVLHGYEGMSSDKETQLIKLLRGF